MSDAFDAQFKEDNSEPVEKPDAAAATEGPVRDDKGRFAPVAAEPVAPTPAPTPEPVAAAPVATPTPEPVKAEPWHVPISALLDERDKRQQLKRELDELRAQQQPSKIPSVTEDPEAFARYQQQLVHETATNTRFETSEIGRAHV